MRMTEMAGMEARASVIDARDEVDCRREWPTRLSTDSKWSVCLV